MVCFSYILICCCLMLLSHGLSINEIKDIFGDKNCIVGTLMTLKQGDGPANKQPLIPAEVYEVLKNEPEEEKSVLSCLNELAQYNDITSSYELINEEGPPHNRVFTVALYLGEEYYVGEARSMKGAQREAARMALKGTQYRHPPLKIRKNAKSETPVALLNNLSMKLGMTVQYEVVNDILEQIEGKTASVDSVPMKKSYLEKLNDTVHSNDTAHVRKDGSDTMGPFTVRLTVNGARFYGKAHTIKGARSEAALEALNYIKANQAQFSCEERGNCKEQKQSMKSPISLVYEAAQARNLPVAFEIVDEFGPSHKKTFTTKCTVGELETTGSGRSKKESKRIAAENMLPGLSEVPPVPGKRANVNGKSKKKNKKNKIVKTTFDKIDRMLDNVVDFGKSLLDKVQGASQDDSKPDKKKGDKHTRPASSDILKLGRLLDIDLMYTDFEDEGKHYALLDLGTKPAFICLGEGVNVKNSRDLAAKYGLNVLDSLGLLDKIFDKSTDLSDILDKELYEDFTISDLKIEEEKKHFEL